MNGDLEIPVRGNGGGRTELSIPGREGVFQLSDATWSLVFRRPHGAVTCGLLRSGVTVEDRGWRKCQVSITAIDEPDFQTSFVAHASGRKLRAELERRQQKLERAVAVEVGVQAGQWWRDRRVFGQFGRSGAVSVAGVCIRSGWEAADRGRRRPPRL